MGCKNNEKSQNAFSYGFDFNLSGKPSNEIYGSKFQPYVYTLQLKSRETHFDIFHAKTIKSLMFFKLERSTYGFNEIESFLCMN